MIARLPMQKAIHNTTIFLSAFLRKSKPQLSEKESEEPMLHIYSLPPLLPIGSENPPAGLRKAIQKARMAYSFTYALKITI